VDVLSQTKVKLAGREPPIVSRRWRRVTFSHTTWNRFEEARPG